MLLEIFNWKYKEANKMLAIFIWMTALKDKIFAKLKFALHILQTKIPGIWNQKNRLYSITFLHGTLLN